MRSTRRTNRWRNTFHRFCATCTAARSRGSEPPKLFRSLLAWSFCAISFRPMSSGNPNGSGGGGMTSGTVVVVVLEGVVELEVDEVVEELVEPGAEAAPAADGAIPIMVSAAASATAPRDLSSILLDVGIDTPHLESRSVLYGSADQPFSCGEPRSTV